MEGYSDEDDDKKDNNKYPTYKQLNSILKKYKNKKGFTYDVIDAGNECRLYGKSAISKTASIKELPLVYFTYSIPYIEIKNIKGKCKVSYKIQDEVHIACYTRLKGKLKKIKYRTNNRKLNYDINKCKWKVKKIKNNPGAYHNIIKMTTSLSSNNNPNLSSLNKLNKMYGQKSFYFTYTTTNNDNCFGIKKFGSYTRKKWQKLIKIYEEALALY